MVIRGGLCWNELLRIGERPPHAICVICAICGQKREVDGPQMTPMAAVALIHVGGGEGGDVASDSPSTMGLVLLVFGRP